MADGKIPAFILGVVDHDTERILAQAAVADDAMVTFGSHTGSTLVIPADYGIESRLVIRDRALIFLPGDTVAVYRPDRTAEIRKVSSPFPIGGPMILETGSLRVLVKLVWMPPAELVGTRR